MMKDNTLKKPAASRSRRSIWTSLFAANAAPEKRDAAPVHDGLTGKEAYCSDRATD